MNKQVSGDWPGKRQDWPERISNWLIFKAICLASIHRDICHSSGHIHLYSSLLDPTFMTWLSSSCSLCKQRCPMCVCVVQLFGDWQRNFPELLKCNDISQKKSFLLTNSIDGNMQVSIFSPISTRLTEWKSLSSALFFSSSPHARRFPFFHREERERG